MRKTPTTLIHLLSLLLLTSAPELAKGLQGVLDIAAGGSRECAIVSEGGLKCWGDNSVGELGTGTKLDRSFPCDVVGLTSGVAAAAPGEHHTCALLSTGGVKCWGDNYLGQLGNGTTTDKLTPYDVSGLSSGVTGISSGAYHSCALKSNGGMVCWGGNSFGSIGDGTTLDRLAPVSVQNLASGVSAIAAGGYHSCALVTGGAIKCWGSNFYGQLGDATQADKRSPADVIDLGGTATALAAGEAHTCALMSGGGVRCWGSNRFGTLGDGTTSDSSRPVDVSGLSGVNKITARGYHTCALLSGGGVKCWGKNFSGELGDGTTVDSNVPVDVSGLSTGVLAIAAANNSTCALLDTHTPKCWGDNFYGTLGDGTTADSSTPVTVLDILLLTGTVSLGSTGLPGVTLTMTRAADSSRDSGVTNSSGVFSIPNMTDATAYRLAPAKDGYNFEPPYVDSTMAGNKEHNFAAVAWTPSPTPVATETPTPTVTPTPGGPTPTPSIVAPTATPTSLIPRVKALKSVIFYKDSGSLRYQISERTGRTKETIKVKKGKRILKTLSVKMKAIPYTGVRSVKFSSKGMSMGKYSFCVVATNPKGKKSKESCAELKIK